MKHLIILLLSLIPFFATAQIYEAQLKPEGIIFPRVNSTQRTALSNLTVGQTVFDIDQQKLFWYENVDGWVSPAVFKEFDSGLITLNQRTNNHGNLLFTHNGAQTIDTTNNSGWGNTILGVSAGPHLTQSSANTFLGHLAGYNQQAGHGNTFIGIGAGKNVDSTYWNTFIGIDAGNHLLKGSENVAIGGEAMLNADSSYGNVIIGANAFRNATGGQANNNVVIGKRAFMQFPAGWDNVVIGLEAGEQADSLYGAVIIGHKAGFKANAENVFIGNTSGENAKDGHGNTFVGNGTGRDCTTGWGNTLIGTNAGNKIGIGGENTFVGDVAGTNLVDGYRNTLIGQLAGLNLVSGSGNVYIGGQVGASPDYTTPFSEDNTLRIHNGSDPSPLIMGKFDARTLTINGAMAIQDFVRLTPSTTPTNPEKGTMYYDANDDKVKVWTGNMWENLFFSAATNPSETHFNNQNGRNNLCNTVCLDELTEKLKQQSVLIELQQTQLKKQQDQMNALQQQMKLLVNSTTLPTKQTQTVALPTQGFLAQNQPNPFNGQTIITYVVPAHVKDAALQITSSNGAILKSINLVGAGKGELMLQTDTYTAGIYYYSLVLDGVVFETKRMVLHQ